MYCTSCGVQNDDDARFCKDCGKAMSGSTPRAGRFEPESPSSAGSPAPPAHVPSYLVPAILVTIFCCLPFGIVSIVYAAQVNEKLNAGDVAGAMSASNNAKTWMWVAFGVGLFVAVFYGLGGLWLGLVPVTIVGSR